MVSHRRAYTNLPKNVPAEPQPEEISSQIDRLNQVLEVVMKEIEISSISRNPSRMSAFNSELYGEPVLHSDNSEDEELQYDYGSTIEKLLQFLDRQQMVIEDFCSAENRNESKIEGNSKLCQKCSKNFGNIRKDLWTEFSKLRHKDSEKERKAFEERISALDEIKAEYMDKKKEIMVGMEKLNLKEQLLQEKEKELRAQRLNFDKEKNVWEKRNGVDTKPEVIKPSERAVHSRAASFTYLTSPLMTPEKQGKNDLDDKQELLKRLQSELAELELHSQDSYKSVHIESLKNQIARIRGDLVMLESSKASRLLSNMMISMQKEVQRDEKVKRNELIEAASKNLGASIKSNPVIPIKPTPLLAKNEGKEEFKKLYDSRDTVVSKTLLTKVKEEKKSLKKSWPEKEKELAAREALLQQTWMRVPGAKELIENVNLTVARLNSEKVALDKEREEFDRERKEWLKSVERLRVKQ